MSYALTATSEAGKRFQTACESVVETLRGRADEADRLAQVEAANFADLQAAGIAGAFVPEDLGGMGLSSVHDWMAGIAALARGDGSTAIAINMHLSVSRGMAGPYTAAVAAGKDAAGLAAPLKAIAAGKMLVCATATERGTDNLHPLTEATPVDGGWAINGTKMFVTMSPIATHLGMNLRMRDDDGDHLVTTLMPMDTPGIQQQNDWDALGMRASGSQSVRFEDVRVGKSALRRLGAWGEWSARVLVNRTLGNLTLVAAFLGIAEHARELALAHVGKSTRVDQTVSESAGVRNLVGEMEIETAKCQAILRASGALMDERLAEFPGGEMPLEHAHELMKDYQAAKWVTNRGAIDIVSMAMDLCGGAGFMNTNTLARLYRDVRAGPFMQPFAAAEIRDYVGRVALGQPPKD